MNIALARKVAISSAKNAGRLLMRNFKKVKNVSLKAQSDIVTEIDIKSERCILNSIKKYFPDHAILSEEEGFIDGDSRYKWIIDPIDGTINYYHASAPFRVGVCLLDER